MTGAIGPTLALTACHAGLAAVASTLAAERRAHRLVLEFQAEWAAEAGGMAEVARGLNGRGVPLSPWSGGVDSHNSRAPSLR